LDLSALGWDAGFAAALASHDPNGGLAPARVSADHGGIFELLTPGGALRGEVSGRLAYLAGGPEDLPAVGDWVAVSPRPEERAATIHEVLPRRTALVRKAAGPALRAQVLAANLDTALLVASANRDFNARRLERACAVVAESGASAVVVINKIDLWGDPAPLVAEAQRAAPGAPVLALSAATGAGMAALEPHLPAGRTLVLLGSSGVGKSTLANRLLGRDAFATGAIREDDDRGRHTTSHRQLLVMPGGAVLVDTPGLREIGLLDDVGLAGAFPELEALAAECRFGDCGHDSEPGCAVRRGLEDGSLDPARFASYRKLGREVEALRARRDPEARAERRRKWKSIMRARRRAPHKRDFE
jgi:ribosome biogenesis GTPase